MALLFPAVLPYDGTMTSSKPPSDKSRGKRQGSDATRPLLRRRAHDDRFVTIDKTDPNQRLSRPVKPADAVEGSEHADRPKPARKPRPEADRPRHKAADGGTGERAKRADDRPRRFSDRPKQEGERHRPEGEKPRSSSSRARPTGERARPDGDRARPEGKPRPAGLRDGKPRYGKPERAGPEGQKPERARPEGGKPWHARPDRAGPERSKTEGGAPGKPRKAHWKPAPIPAAGLEGLAAREAAVTLLHEVLSEHRPLDDVLQDGENFPQLLHLARADKGFARAMAATALRRLGQIDDALERFLEMGLPKNSGLLREILFVAAAQLLFLGSPPHAVINVAVQQAKTDPKSRPYAKLANAVLRRVSEKGADILKEQDAARLNTPIWLWQSWVKDYGDEVARKICDAHLEQALLDLSVREDPAGWAEKTGGTLLPTGTVRLKHKGRVERLAGFDEGAWWVQDAAAALPALLLGEVHGKEVLDLAAAPGGKTAQLAARGAHVTALDWSAGRLDRLAENMQRLHLQADIVKADILDWKPKGKYDAVLLDAPCTATGTIRRHPDLPFLKKPEDIDELVVLQAAMLDKALTFLKPGGLLVYCTCSLQEEEGQGQITALLARNARVVLEPLSADNDGLRAEWISPDGCLRTLPFHAPAEDMEAGMDGFFAARMRLRS